MRKALVIAVAALAGCSLFKHRPPTVRVAVEISRAASAAENERALAQPLEVALNGLPELVHVESTSTEVGTQAVVELRAGEPFVRAQEVSDKLEPLRTQLPPDADPPIVRAQPSAAQPPLELVLRASALSGTELRALADDVVRKAVLTTPGVVDVDRCGGREPIVEIDVDGARAAAAGVSVEDIADKLADRPLHLGGPALRFEDLEALELTGLLRLKDVAMVRRTGRALPCDAWLDGQMVIADEVRFGPAATRDDVKTLEAKLAALAPQLGQAKLEVLPPATARETLRFPDERVLSKLPMAVRGQALVRATGREAELLTWTTEAPEVDRIPGIVATSVELDGKRRAQRVDVCGPDLELDEKVAREVAAQLHGFADAERVPQRTVTVDRERAARYRLQAGEVTRLVSAAVDGLEVSSLWEPNGAQVPVVVRTDALESARLRTPDGAVIPLTQVVRVEQRLEPARIRRVDGQRCVAVYAVPPADGARNWLSEARQRIASRVQLPAGVSVLWRE